VVSKVVVAHIEIVGINDRGVSQGRRFIELYGRFEASGVPPSSLEPRVVCGNRYVGGRIEYASPAQINISIPDAGSAMGCTFVLRQPGTGLSSPTYGDILEEPGLPDNSGSAPRQYGIYFWGGSTGGMPDGQRALTAAGFKSTRIVITPRVRTGHALDNYYNFDLAAWDASCPQNVMFLPCAIRRPEYQAAISSPSLDTVVLTAYDSASTGPTGSLANYIDPMFWTNSDNIDAVKHEYEELTYALYQTQHNSVRARPKTFVLTSWEADNQAYCGSFYLYWRDADFRDNPQKCGGGIQKRRDALSAFAKWFEVRRAGITAGRLRAEGEGYLGVRVTDGIEFNMNTLTYTYEVDGEVLPSVLRDVVPTSRPEFVLYSSYDSQFRGRMEQDLRQLQNWLATNAPGSKLSIGEVGFPRHSIDGTETFRTVETVKAIQRVGLPIVILWEAYDTSSDGRIRAFGAFHESGQARSVVPILKRELRAQQQEIATLPTARIFSANDRGVAWSGDASYRHFELYGHFPDGPFGATALCDGTEAPIDVTYQSANQINVRLAHPGIETRYCTLRVIRQNGTRSLAYGPVID
jgi:hypothetical protein